MPFWIEERLYLLTLENVASVAGLTQSLRISFACLLAFRLIVETAPPGAGTFAYTVKMYSIFNAKWDLCQPPSPPLPEASSFEFKGVDE